MRHWKGAMRIDDARLLAYVDGELPRAMSDEVERAIDGSPEMAARVELLRASQLPYGEIFGKQALPALPASLAGRIDCLLIEHPAGVASNMKRRASGPSIKHERWFFGRLFGTPVNASASQLGAGLLRTRSSLRALVAAFSTGVACCGVTMTVYLAANAGGDRSFSVASTSGAAPWIAAAAEYQALYTRGTVELVQPDMRVTAATVGEVNDQDKLAMQIPDLRSVGLTFKRVQRLEFDGSALVQIVYLPEKGSPVALCVRKEGLADTIPASYRINGMEVVSWHRQKLAYALLGRDDNVSLGGLAEAIYGGHDISVIGPSKS
jgi:anti-sigma factor RsiW